MPALLTLALLLAASSAPKPAAEPLVIEVDAASPTGRLPLRLNDAVQGWTHSGWTELFQDLNVHARRMDGWLSGFRAVRRQPNGALHFDFGLLDKTLRDATASFSLQPYPVLGYSPACLTTDLLEDPLPLGPTEARLTADGGFLLLSEPPGRPAATRTPRTLRRVSRKGIVEWERPGVRSFALTDAGTILVSLGAEGVRELNAQGREVWSLPEGEGLQRVSDSRVLVILPGRVSEVHSSGREVWRYSVPARHAHHGASGDTWVVRADLPRVDRVDLTERLRWTLTPQDNPDLTEPLWVHEAAPGTALVRQPDSLLLVSDSKQTLWRKGYPGLRDVWPLPEGGCVVAFEGGLEEVNASGERVWSLPVEGALSVQVVQSPGLRTLVYGTAAGACEVDPSGRLWWQYENHGPFSYWARTPPEILGWSLSVAALVGHLTQELRVPVHTWELWGSAEPHGSAWAGSVRSYLDLCFSTRQTLRQADPESRLHLPVIGGGEGAARHQLTYLDDRGVELDGMSFQLHAPESGRSGASGPSLPELLEERVRGLRAALQQSPRYAATPLICSEWSGGGGRASALTAAAARMSDLGLSQGVAYAIASEGRLPQGWVTTPSGLRPAPLPGDDTWEPTTALTFTQAYDAARLWSALGEERLTARFQPAPEEGLGALATRNAAGEVAVLLWREGLPRGGEAADAAGTGGEQVPEVTTLRVQGVPLAGPQWWVRRYVAGGAAPAQALRMEESRRVAAAPTLEIPVAVGLGEVHLVVVAVPRLEARAAYPGMKEPVLTVTAHQPVRFEAAGATGIPLYYRWDLGTGAGLRGPGLGVPAQDVLFGPSPTLTRGFTAPGRFTVTLWTSVSPLDPFATPESLAAGLRDGTIARSTLEVRVLEDREAPDRPTSLLADTGGSLSDIYLRWAALPWSRNPDVAGFHVYRSLPEGEGMERLTTAPIAATGYVDRGVPAGRLHRYAVTAVDHAGNESPRSEVATAALYRTAARPAPPVRLSGHPTTDGRLVLDWADVSLAAKARVVGYHVYRSGADGRFERLTPEPTPYTRYIDAGVTPDAAYRVTSVDHFGNESPASTTLRRAGEPADAPGEAPPEEDAPAPAPESSPEETP